MKITQCERCGDDVSYDWMMIDVFIAFIPWKVKKPKFCAQCQAHFDELKLRELRVARQRKIAEWELKNYDANDGQK